MLSLGFLLFILNLFLVITLQVGKVLGVVGIVLGVLQGSDGEGNEIFHLQILLRKMIVEKRGLQN